MLDSNEKERKNEQHRRSYSCIHIKTLVYWLFSLCVNVVVVCVKSRHQILIVSPSRPRSELAFIRDRAFIL